MWKVTSKRREWCFSVKAKQFSFSAKSEVSDLRWEERRKGFCGIIFSGSSKFFLVAGYHQRGFEGFSEGLSLQKFSILVT
jgi:hypothetical protein